MFAVGAVGDWQSGDRLIILRAAVGMEIEEGRWVRASQGRGDGRSIMSCGGCEVFFRPQAVCDCLVCAGVDFERAVRWKVVFVGGGESHWLSDSNATSNSAKATR